MGKHQKKKRPRCVFCGALLVDDWPDGPPMEERNPFFAGACKNPNCWLALEFGKAREGNEKPLPLLPLVFDPAEPF